MAALSVAQRSRENHKNEFQKTASELAGDAVLGDPLLNGRWYESPELSDLDGGDLTSQNHALKRARMDSEELGGLVAVDEWGGAWTKYRRLTSLWNGRFAQLGHRFSST